METIAKDAGISKPTVNKAIKHLVANGDITVRKEGRRNIYKFNPLSKNFEMFTYKFMRDVDLTTQQRIYIILTQQHMYKDEEGYGKMTYSDSELAEQIGLSAELYIEEIKNWKIKESYKYLIRERKMKYLDVRFN